MKASSIPTARKWASVIIIGLILGVSSRLFGSGEMFKNLFLKGNRYAYLCDENAHYTTDPDYDIVSCAAQDAAMKKLMTTYKSLENLGSIAAGVLFDLVGPRKCGLLGVILVVLQFVFQTVSSEWVDGMAIGAIFGGIAVNILAFPGMILEDMFPGNEALAVTYVVGTQGLSSLVPPVLLTLYMDMDHIPFEVFWRTFTLFVIVPLGILYVWILPNERPIKDNSDEEDENAKQKEQPIADQIEELVKIAFSPEYLIMVFLVGFLILIGSWWIDTAMPELLGKRITNMTGWLMWTDSIFGIFQGKLCDTVGTPVMLLIQLASFCLIFLASLAGESPAQYITVFLWISTMAYTYCIKYTFAQGIAGVISGVFLIFSNVIDEMADARYWCMVFAMMCGSLVPLPLYLWHKKVQNEKQLKQD